MIFVTVGTHEQQFNRLIKTVDDLKMQKLIVDEVFMQIGYSDYLPVACSYEKFIAHERMDEMMSKADIIITHAGPGSIFHCFRYEKVPVVVPRQPRFNEHVDLHQVRFTEFLENKKTIIAVYDLHCILDVITQYKSLSLHISPFIVNGNLEAFIKRMNEICTEFLSRRPILSRRRIK